MSSGNFDDTPAPIATLDTLLREQPEIATLSKREHKINRSHDIPYIGGSSKDGRTVFIDRNLPSKVGGIAVDKYLMIHEAIEYALVRTLGYGYERAHHLATAAEKRAVEADGHSWAKYQGALRPFYKPIEHEKLVDPPKDLALYPYSGALRQVLEQVAHGKITKARANYRHEGVLNKRCGLCSMFRASGACTLVAGRIALRALCDRFKARK